jgi:hypothetical protein
MATAPIIALRFQRADLQAAAGLSALGQAMLAETRGPNDLIETLAGSGHFVDAINALAQMLPHRQAVWWACLAARLVPGLADRREEVAAVKAAEDWVQTAAADAATAAAGLAETCSDVAAPYWAAMAAYWSGPSLAPPGIAPVRPAPHLPGIAVRTALHFVVADPAVTGRLAPADMLDIGLDLMRGNLGRAPQAALTALLASA